MPVGGAFILITSSNARRPRRGIQTSAEFLRGLDWTLGRPLSLYVYGDHTFIQRIESRASSGCQMGDHPK